MLKRNVQYPVDILIIERSPASTVYKLQYDASVYTTIY